MQISEIYESRQGEGLLTGTLSVFIRTSGCNLRCHFCDTPFTSWQPRGEKWSVSKIVDRALTYEARHAVVTGGEPMLPLEIVDLTEALARAGFHITIETAGTIDRPVTCDLISVSPKLSNSTPPPERSKVWAERHEQRRFQPQTWRRLIDRYSYQLKFVVASPADLNEIQATLNAIGQVDPGRVLLMPEGIHATVLAERAAWLQPLASELGFQYCPRKHIEWYGNRRGT